MWAACHLVRVCGGQACYQGPEYAVLFVWEDDLRDYTLSVPGNDEK